MQNLSTSFQMSELLSNDVSKGTQISRQKHIIQENQKEKSYLDSRKDCEGTQGVNKKDKPKKKKGNGEVINYIQNIMNKSLSVLEEEQQYLSQTPKSKKIGFEECQTQKINENSDIESFSLPPTATQISQQKKRSHKKEKNKKNKGDSQIKIQKNQTLTQKQQPQQPQYNALNKEKISQQLSPQESQQKKQQLSSQKQKKIPSITQLENIEQQSKKDSGDFENQTMHICGRSTTAGNSQTESDDGLPQILENKQFEQSDSKQLHKKKKNSTNGEKIGDKQYSHSTQTTPIKKKQLFLGKSQAQDIDEFTKQIKQKSQLNRLRKRICLNRLHYIISLNYNCNIYPYGSFDTGLDLEDSDVDVGIWGQQNFNYGQIVNFLQCLSMVLKQTPFLVNLKLIQSHMPILKLELNPKSYFYNEDPHVQQNWSGFHLDPQDTGKIISVDITWVQQQWANMYNNPHLGFASTAIVKDWLSRFVWYKDIMLILKHLVKSKKLNDAHTGGISSFCLSIMLAAIYMTKHYTQNDKKIILLDFLKKYGTQFDAQKEGIYIDAYGQQNPFIQIEESPPFNPLTIYSPMNYQIISQKANKFPEIQEEFKKLYEHLTKNNKLQDYFDVPQQVNQQLFI